MESSNQTITPEKQEKEVRKAWLSYSGLLQFFCVLLHCSA